MENILSGTDHAVRDDSVLPERVQTISGLAAPSSPSPFAHPTMHPTSSTGLPAPTCLAEDLRSEASRLGFSRVGIAAAGRPPHHDLFRNWLDRGYAGAMEAWLRRHEPLRGDPSLLLPGARSVIVLATDYSGSATDHPAETVGRGRVSRYARGDDYHGLLRKRLNALGSWLERRAPGCRTRGVVDSAPLAERDFGWLGGLGWFGKNTMLIHPAAGSFFFLSALVADVELPVDEPIRVDHCGTCTSCIDACPTGALVEPRVLDARKCISTLTIEDRGPVPPALREGMGAWVFGCDICQDVCPWNRHAPATNEPAFAARNDESTLSLTELLQLDDAGFRIRFQGSPILRATRCGLARSAAIALGNHPDPAAADALETAVRAPEAIIREAAVWALERWIEKGVRPHWARDLLRAQAHSTVSSTSADGSRPGASTA
jgi:epoxyqueuosine reductase